MSTSIAQLALFEAKTKVFEQRAAVMFTDAEFFAVAATTKVFPSTEPNKLNFAEYRKLRSSLQPYTCRRYFSASVFMKLPKDQRGLVKTEDLLGVIQRTMDVERMLLNIILYSSALSIDDVISEGELERFVSLMTEQQVWPTEMRLKEFPTIYSIAACRKFMFFLDRKFSGQLSIRRLVLSGVMDEWLFLRRFSQYEDEMDPVSFKTQLEGNWFSVNNIARVYNQFLDLDADGDGVLSKAEFIKYGGSKVRPVQLTSVAVDRIFEESFSAATTGSGRLQVTIDFKAFLDFILAIENAQTVQSICYFFRLLDINRSGRVSATDIAFFYSEVLRRLQESGYDAPSVADLRVEVFDMVGVNYSEGITLQDLQRCGQGHIVASLLLDVTGFWRYDNRESLLQAAETDANSDVDAFDDVEDDTGVSEERNNTESSTSARAPSTAVQQVGSDVEDDYEYEDDFF